MVRIEPAFLVDNRRLAFDIRNQELLTVCKFGIDAVDCPIPVPGHFGCDVPPCNLPMALVQIAPELGEILKTDKPAIIRKRVNNPLALLFCRKEI